MQNELALYDEVSGFFNEPEIINFLSEDTVVKNYIRNDRILPGTDFILPFVQANFNMSDRKSYN